MTGSADVQAPGRRRAVVLVLAAAVVVALLLVVVLVVRPGARRPVSAPTPAPAATAGSTPTLAVRDEREVTIEDLTVALPGRPFSCFDPRSTEPPGLDGYVSCDATVHDYAATGDAWVAQVDVVLLDGSLGHADDLERSAREAFRSFYRASFTEVDSPSLSDEVGEPFRVHGPDARAYRHRARVHVHRKDLATTYDLVSVVVVRLRSGRVAALYSDLPEDAKADVVRAALVSELSMTLH
ncbi:MAG TPA: hypothetical protein VGC37_07750 [Friedmanniella sp.]